MAELFSGSRTTHTYTYAVCSRSIQCSRVLWCKRPAFASRPQGPDQGTECVCATRCMQPPRHLQLHSALCADFQECRDLFVVWGRKAMQRLTKAPGAQRLTLTIPCCIDVAATLRVCTPVGCAHVFVLAI